MASDNDLKKVKRALATTKSLLKRCSIREKTAAEKEAKRLRRKARAKKRLARLKAKQGNPVAAKIATAEAKAAEQTAQELETNAERFRREREADKEKAEAAEREAWEAKRRGGFNLFGMVGPDPGRKKAKKGGKKAKKAKKSGKKGKLSATQKAKMKAGNKRYHSYISIALARGFTLKAAQKSWDRGVPLGRMRRVHKKMRMGDPAPFDRDPGRRRRRARRDWF